MPVVASSFRPPFLLRNGHVQTIVGALLPRRLTLAYDRERLELADGDFLDLDWARAGNKRLTIISHGLEGSADNSSIRGAAAALQAAGWDVLAWNFRGCSGSPNRLPRSYHSGESGDLGLVIKHAAEGYADIALVGYSLGGNVTLKYLGEASPHPAVRVAAAISVPIDLASCARALDTRRLNKIYLKRFINSLVKKMNAKAAQFPDRFEVEGIQRIGSFQEFDDRFTSRIHGFRDANDYWTRCSARQFLPNISLPTLLLNAIDDPFLTEASFPYPEAEASKHLHLETPKHGGHIGFLDQRGFWSENRVAAFLSEHA